MEFIKKVNWIRASEKDFDMLPNSDAVYVLVALAKNNKNIVFYTGQTTDIKQRSKDHWLNNEAIKMIKKIIANYPKFIFVYYALVDKSSLDGNERYLYNYFEPQAQDRAPDVNPKPIILPPDFTKGRLADIWFK